MKPWSDAAEQEFARYCDRRRTALLASGADPDEVFADWRSHIVEEAVRNKADAVAEEDVRRLMARLEADPPAGSEARTFGSAALPPPDPAPRLLSIPAVVVFALFGVALPLITLLVESLTGLCASLLFDPMPTLAHGVLIALVPLANLLALVALRQRAWRPWRAMLWLNGLALGVTLYYTLHFSAFTPFAVIGVLYLGLGLLPLSPLISLICALLLRRSLGRAARATAAVSVPVWRPLLAAFLVLLLLALPTIIAMTGLNLAASEDAHTRARGLRLLRTVGSREELLRASYVQRPVTFDPIVWLGRQLAAEPLPLEKIREIYYRVTGQPFNAVRPPNLRGRGGALFNADEWDFAQSGDQVAARLRGLTLAQSRLDGRVEAEAGLAYLEWTLVFQNAAAVQREARAQILLPPGGVVSRLTLWINGEEREAAFSGRGQVRQAYQSVVQRRRDPVLVTTCGPDRILLQCFPVPPNGGTMKTRVGITVPLALLSSADGLLALPRLIEANFGLDPELKPAIWVESDREMVATGLRGERVAERQFTLRGDLTPAALDQGQCCTVRRPAQATRAWCRLERGEPGQQVLQTIRAVPTPPPARIVVVMDGSRRMAAHARETAALVRRLPAAAAVDLFIAADEVVRLGPSGADPRESLARQVENFNCAGGCDNGAALLAAWDEAAAQPGGVVLWLHDTQPLESKSTEALRQRWERRPNGPALYGYQFDSGPDRLTEKLEGVAAFHAVAALRGADLDWTTLLDAWAGRAPWLACERRLTPDTNGAPSDALAASLHLARLWAADEILRLAGTRNTDVRAKAMGLACTWQLVTPLSGAVVLENEEQYRQANLKPVDPDSTPDMVPEPGTLALLGLSGGLLLLAYALPRWFRHARHRCSVRG